MFNAHWKPLFSNGCFLRLWNGVVPDKCRQQYKKGEEWQCFFSHKLYSSLTCECLYYLPSSCKNVSFIYQS